MKEIPADMEKDLALAVCRELGFRASNLLFSILTYTAVLSFGIFIGAAFL